MVQDKGRRASSESFRPVVTSREVTMLGLLAWAVVGFFTFRYYNKRGWGAALTYFAGMAILFHVIDKHLLPFWITLVFAIGLGFVINGFDKRNPEA